MCIVTQLPHVLLLTTTLRQGAPTSLRKCVFEGGEVWARTFAVLYPKVSYADIPDFDDFSSNGCFQNLATHAFVTYALISGALRSKKIKMYDN